MDKKAIARRSDALYCSSNEGISRRWLCDKVAELEHELEQLKELMRDVRTTCPVLESSCAECEHATADYSGEWVDYHCDFDDRMDKLGVEAD